MTLIFSLFLACSDSLVPIKGTTARIDQYHEVERTESELEMVIMTNEEQCQDVLGTRERARNTGEYDQKMVACLPWIDRGAGEVKVAMRFELDGNTFPLPIGSDEIQVIQDLEVLELDPPKIAQRVIGHDAIRVKQLFILMIDGSGSMNRVDAGSDLTRMAKVRTALKRKEVKQAFFPDDVNNHVVIYTFTSGAPIPLGGAVRPIDNAKDYVKMIDQYLKPQGGYTHLYDSVDYGMTKALKDPAIERLLDGETQPTLVVLTDGFNNEEATDTCSSNVPRLQNLIDKMTITMKEQSATERMSVFTVGLGRPLAPKFDVSELNDLRVRERQLCGGRSAKSYIDAPGSQKGLEDSFIDNVSLAMIAEKGYGRTFVSKDARGLGKAFEEVAAVRYQWFEIQYRHNALKMRKEFEARYKLLGFAKSMSAINIYPHAWLDGPPGTTDATGWSVRGTAWHTSTILSSGMGLLLFLSILGAAIFNVRRLLLGRLSRDTK